MKFNAFDQLSPSIDAMKGLLFPFHLKTWLKLGLISLLDGKGSGAGSSGQDVGDIPAESFEGGFRGLRDSLGGWYVLILPLVLLGIIIGLVFTYITSVFTFIFLDALTTKKVAIKKGWRQNKPLGWSFFLFRIAVGLISVVVIILAALPFIVPILQQGVDAYIASFELAWLAWIIPLAFVVFLFFILLSVFVALVYNFTTVHMYVEQLPIRPSLSATFARMREAKLSVFVYLLAKLVLNLVAGIAAVIVGIVLLIPFVIIAIPIALLFVAVASAVGMNAWVVAMIVITAILGLLLFIYAFSVAYLPVSTTLRYFSIKNYQALMA